MSEEKAHILYVDDELDNLTVFKSTFRRDYKIHLANSAKEGVEILKENPQIQLVITDQRMPEITGVEFLESIIPNYPKAIRMILTGFSDMEALVDSINKGQVYKYITKPWDRDKLKETIDKAIESSKTSVKSTETTNNEEVVKLKLANSKLLYELSENISFTRKIQDIMLPDEQVIKKAFSDSFIFYKPKAEVSGDFYWFYDKGDKQFIAIVDCTGHNVQGGLMSIIGNDLLREIIVARNINEADEILYEMHTGINDILKSDESSNQYAMEVAVCVIDKSKCVLEYSGAKHPLCYVFNNQLVEIKGDMYPIGGIWKANETKRVFTKHSIPIEQNKTFYLYSDGFQDQFGGPKRKKFLREPFKDLILNSNQEKLENQKKILNEKLTDWMGEENQLDDILVIGFKI